MSGFRELAYFYATSPTNNAVTVTD